MTGSINSGGDGHLKFVPSRTVGSPRSLKDILFGLVLICLLDVLLTK